MHSSTASHRLHNHGIVCKMCNQDLYISHLNCCSIKTLHQHLGIGGPPTRDGKERSFSKLTLALVDSEGTVLYYHLHDTLKPPCHTDKLLKETNTGTKEVHLDK